MTVSDVDSVRVRVHQYERRFRRKPDRRVPADEVLADLSHDTGGALGDVTDGARFRRTAATCIWGVNDPLVSSVEPRQEGGRGGRSRPRYSFTAADSRSDCDTGGTERRPLTPHRTHRLRRRSVNPWDRALEETSAPTCWSVARGKGEHCSHVCVPPLFLRLRSKLAQPGGPVKGSAGLGPRVRLSSPCAPNRSARGP